MGLRKNAPFCLWEGGPVPKGSDGITIGSLIIVRRGAASPYLLAHEGVHVRQWKRHGRLGFVARYAGSYLRWRLRGKTHRAAYLRIPLEIEADWTARRQLRLEHQPTSGQRDHLAS